ncbi:hypothetical protein GTA08_BOTSDO04377 [Neofusicoccum parvum]|nr:hypothetical protein GTA08_BOTSDO04377 [Neofusicoccum parvum]
MEIMLPVSAVIVPPVAQEWADAGFRVTFTLSPGVTRALMPTRNGLVEFVAPAPAAAPAGPPPPPGLVQTESWGPLDAHIVRSPVPSASTSLVSSPHFASLSSASEGEAGGREVGGTGTPLNPSAVPWAPSSSPPLPPHHQQQQHQQQEASVPHFDTRVLLATITQQQQQPAEPLGRFTTPGRFEFSQGWFVATPEQRREMYREWRARGGRNLYGCTSPAVTGMNDVAAVEVELITTASSVNQQNAPKTEAEEAFMRRTASRGITVRRA